MLRAAGLTALEESAYLALLRQGSATESELAQRLELPARQAPRVAAALQRKGLAHRTPPPHELLVPVPPELGLAQLVDRRRAELEQVRRAAAELAEQARQGPVRRRTEELIEIVQGRAAVDHAFERVQRVAQQEVRVLVAPPYATAGRVNDIELQRLADGLQYRAVYAETVLSEPGITEPISRHVVAGERARLVAQVPIKLAVADQALALLPLAWTATPQDAAVNAAVLVHPCGLLDALVALFESVWHGATPMALAGAARPTGGADGLTPDDRQLLSLLVAGLTDDAAAARLGISRRTVVRRVQYLMEAAGARSRLHLGWRAKELGWLEAGDRC